VRLLVAAPTCDTREKKTTPVTLPVGRLRLATRPSLTRSPPLVKTIGTVAVAGLGRTRRRAIGNDHGHGPANQFGRESREPINLIVRIAVFDATFCPSMRAAPLLGPGGRQLQLRVPCSVRRAFWGKVGERNSRRFG
jgi:hypothetical protein